MATHEQVHKLVKELPEADLDSVAENLTARRDPEAVGPGDIVDDWVISPLCVVPQPGKCVTFRGNWVTSREQR